MIAGELGREGPKAAMSLPLRIPIRIIATAAGLALLAGCATPAPPPPPPPPPPAPPPVVEAIPYRPLPPPGSPYEMNMPLRLSEGEWYTVNTGLNDDETLWHFRSGWNVAALNCNGERYTPITQGYGAFLERFAGELSATNKRIEQQFRSEAETRRDAIRVREAHMTQVYNHFAMPGARRAFCDVALELANESMLTPPVDAQVFAEANLARFDGAFAQFFGEYADYQRLSADWDQRYGARYGASQPGYVAVYGAAGPASGVAASLLAGDPQPSGAVLDPETGALIPVINVPESGSSQPVVQPLPNPEGENSGALASPASPSATGLAD